jgi:murein DD-endopeptidase MepM/ murein hydrolase activator NlpD
MIWEFWIIAVVVLLAASDQRERALEAQIADLKEHPRTPPHHPPLEQAWISSGNGYRMDPMGGDTEGLHKGVDLVGPVGSPVIAVLTGTVVEHWPSPDSYWRGHPIYGGLVVIDHGEGLFTLYGHLSETCVHEGYQVEAGQVIGKLGDTGVTTGPHLHFEVVVDPLRYLEER